jgi:hypothetical protein
MSSNKPTQLITFLGTGVVAYILLVFLGQGSLAWQTVQDSLKEPLKTILAGAIASAAALLVPALRRPKAEPQPVTPVQSVAIATSNEPTVPLSVYSPILKEVDEWRVYGAEIKGYIEKIESASSILDTRQAVLRVSAYAILGLSLFLTVAGFLAPTIVHAPGTQLEGSVLVLHFLYLAGALAFGGFVIGLIIFRIHARTEAWHARRSALVATLLVNLAALLVSLPYIFPRMWNEPVTVYSISLPLLLWLALFRLVVSPIISAIFGYLGFFCARWMTEGKKSAPAIVFEPEGRRV